MDTPPRVTAALSDRYLIEREIGAGGMALVYLARDRKLDREVALKVLRPELGAVLGAERFLTEIKISARLDHPHILTLIDSGDADGNRLTQTGLSLGTLQCMSPEQATGDRGIDACSDVWCPAASH